MNALCYVVPAMNNPVTIAVFTAAVSLVVLVFSIFAAAWLNQRGNERLLEQIDRRLGDRINALESKMDTRINALESKMDARFDTLTVEIRRLDQRIDAVEHRLDKIERQLEAIFKPVLPPR